MTRGSEMKQVNDIIGKEPGLNEEQIYARLKTRLNGNTPRQYVFEDFLIELQQDGFALRMNDATYYPAP